MITDHMVELSKTAGTHKGFVIIDDEYILISDSESLQEIIPKTSRLRENGVNYYGPVEYRVVDGKYYYLEYRAKGKVLEYSSCILPLGRDDDYKEYKKSYLKLFE